MKKIVGNNTDFKRMIVKYAVQYGFLESAPLNASYGFVTWSLKKKKGYESARVKFQRHSVNIYAIIQDINVVVIQWQISRVLFSFQFLLRANVKEKNAFASIITMN